MSSEDVIGGANSLPDLIALCAAPEGGAEETVFAALKAGLRCVRDALEASPLYHLACTADAKVHRAHAGALPDAKMQPALELMQWAHRQMSRLLDAVAALAGHDEGGLAIPAIRALGELMALQHQALSHHQVPCSLNTGLIEKVWLDSLDCAFLLFFSLLALQTLDVLVTFEPCSGVDSMCSCARFFFGRSGRVRGNRGPDSNRS